MEPLTVSSLFTHLSLSKRATGPLLLVNFLPQALRHAKQCGLLNRSSKHIFISWHFPVYINNLPPFKYLYSFFPVVQSYLCFTSMFAKNFANINALKNIYTHKVYFLHHNLNGVNYFCRFQGVSWQWPWPTLMPVGKLTALLASVSRGVERGWEQHLSWGTSSITKVRFSYALLKFWSNKGLQKYHVKEY